MINLFVVLALVCVAQSAPVAKTVTVPIYDGSTGTLSNGFATWGWGRFNLMDKTIVRPGSKYAVSFICKDWTAIYLAGYFGYAAEHVDSISFSINGGTTPGAKVALVVQQDFLPAGNKVDISDLLKVNEWVDLTIPFSKFGISGENATKMIDSLWFQSNSQNYTGTIYIDKIRVGATRQWNLAWSDEFDSFDTKTWTPLTGTHGPSSNEKEYYIPDEISVSNGNLVIRTRKNVPTQNSIYNYTSGWVDTKGKFSHLYGRWEVYAKLPGTWAIWPAHWLMPEDGACWPRNGEIDIMEIIGSDLTKLYGSYHWTDKNDTCYKATLNTGGTIKTGVDLSQDYHLYSIEWTKDCLSYLFDDIHYWTLCNDGYDGHEFPSDGIPQTPMYWILNTALGGSWPGFPDKRTVLPVYHYIDYVRVYDAAK